MTRGTPRGLFGSIGFRRDLRAGRFAMEFAQSGSAALQRISDAAGVSLILIVSDINMPGMSGLELLSKAKAARPAEGLYDQLPNLASISCNDVSQ